MKAQDFSNVMVWGLQNEEKSHRWMRWDHDFLLFATYKDKLTVLEDPTIILPHIFDRNIEEVESRELYDGVYEYKINGLTVEMIDGFEYSEYKIYGKDVDFDAIINRLVAAGATHKKPDIPIVIPDRPPVVDVDNLYNQRYDYKEDIYEKDTSMARTQALKSLGRNLFTFIFVGFFAAFLGYELFVPKLQDVTPDSVEFITAKNNLIVYNVEGRMTIFKIADLVEDVGYDSTCSIYIPEDSEISRKVVVERLVNSEGEVIYNRKNRVIDFEPDPKDYGFVNSNPFEFDKYRRGGDVDWSKYGELDGGEAEKIILRGRVDIREGKYVLILGKTLAVLGDASEGVQPFYELLADEVSRAAILYSLKAKKQIALYGQIQKTLSSREGRNSVQRMIFDFKTDYSRQR